MLLLPVTYPEALTREDQHPDIMWLCFPVHTCTLTPGYTDTSKRRRDKCGFT